MSTSDSGINIHLQHLSTKRIDYSSSEYIDIPPFTFLRLNIFIRRYFSTLLSSNTSPKQCGIRILAKLPTLNLDKLYWVVDHLFCDGSF